MTKSNRAIWLQRAKELLNIDTDDEVDFILFIDKTHFMVATKTNLRKWPFVGYAFQQQQTEAGRGSTSAALAQFVWTPLSVVDCRSMS